MVAGERDAPLRKVWEPRSEFKVSKLFSFSHSSFLFYFFILRFGTFDISTGLFVVTPVPGLRVDQQMITNCIFNDLHKLSYFPKSHIVGWGSCATDGVSSTAGSGEWCRMSKSFHNYSSLTQKKKQ